MRSHRFVMIIPSREFSSQQQNGMAEMWTFFEWCFGMSLFQHTGYFVVAGEAPDGTRYKTDYRCEGDRMTVSCEPGETIQVVRANYGRFSIAICNKHGYTNWSVNCMSHTTTRILQKRYVGGLSLVYSADCAILISFD